MQSLEQDVQNMYFIYTFLGYLLKAKPEIQLVAPKARNCLFSHENDHLDLYSEYTYSNCRCLFLLFFCTNTRQMSQDLYTASCNFLDKKLFFQTS